MKKTFLRLAVALFVSFISVTGFTPEETWMTGMPACLMIQTQKITGIIGKIGGCL